jgi:hypothetical protein
MEIEAVVEPVLVSRDALPGAARRAVETVVEVISEALASALRSFFEEMGQALSAAPATVGPYEIDHVELAVGMAQSGSLRIVTSSANASMKVVLRRPVGPAGFDDGL